MAFGADGAPSKALEGFCKKNGVSAADVTREADAKGVEYVWAVVRSEGRPAAEVSEPQDLCPKLRGPPGQGFISVQGSGLRALSRCGRRWRRQLPAPRGFRVTGFRSGFKFGLKLMT